MEEDKEDIDASEVLKELVEEEEEQKVDARAPSVVLDALGKKLAVIELRQQTILKVLRSFGRLLFICGITTKEDLRQLEKREGSDGRN